MKYMAMMLLNVAGCLAVGWLLVRLASRGRKTPWSLGMRVLLSLACGTALMATIAIAYLGSYYRAGDKAMAACEGTPQVVVNKVHGSFFFDGPGGDTALIFLPGAKVQPQAYAPMMLALAEQGIDCFLMDSPIRVSFFSVSDIDEIIREVSYRHWLIGGHSMGGVTAASYASEHVGQFGAVVLLASYPVEKISDGVSLLSVYGTEDGCLDRNQYESSRSLWPADSQELVIEGGNHAGFGDYGPQRGDGNARIGAEEQQELTIEAIVALVGRMGESN